MTLTANYWVQHLGLAPHPEGGYFKETYRATENIPQQALPDRFTGDRSFSTAIYFLLGSGQFSALHRIAADELWHFYAGSSLTVSIIHPNGKLEEIHLGANPEKGEVLQAVVPHGTWFGSRVKAENSFALVGCTVAPGFDFADFEMPGRTRLLLQFPQHSDIIHTLTNP
ncbi:MAG: cupin domain-containing protein [Bacteroidia bacterium]